MVSNSLLRGRKGATVTFNKRWGLGMGARVRRRFALTVGVAVLTAHLPTLDSGALAAGYGVREFSANAMGRAYAGSSADGSDPSFLAYNPAAASGVADWDAAAGLIAVWPTSNAQYWAASAFGGQIIGGEARPEGFVKAAYVPDASIRYRIAPEWSVGLSVSAPWGLTTTYDRTWVGRYHAHETKLLTVNVAPAVAYQPIPELTLGIAANVQYATGRMSNAIDIGTIGAVFSIAGAAPTVQDGYGAFDAEDWGLGYTLGVNWAASDQLHLGASYRSEIEHHLTGPVAFSIGTSATGVALAGAGLLQNTRGATDLTTPAVASVGFVLDVTPRWSLGGELSFTDWSVFQELRVKFANPLQPDEVTQFKWKDSWFGGLGITYRASESCEISVGGAYDESPAGAARNARIPDADRVWLSAGVEFGLSERSKLKLSVAHLFVPEEAINLSAAEPSNMFRGDLTGVTDAEATAVGVQLTFK